MGPGYGVGERGHWGKGSLYEIDTRVPFIVRDPAARRGAGKRSDMLVELVDLYKSIIDLANLPFEKNLYNHLEGKSVRPLVEDPDSRRWDRESRAPRPSAPGDATPRGGTGPTPFAARRGRRGRPLAQVRADNPAQVYLVLECILSHHF